MMTASYFYQSFCKFPTADAQDPQHLQMLKGQFDSIGVVSKGRFL
jgi:hypothetical protein